MEKETLSIKFNDVIASHQSDESSVRSDVYVFQKSGDKDQKNLLAICLLALKADNGLYTVYTVFQTPKGEPWVELYDDYSTLSDINRNFMDFANSMHYEGRERAGTLFSKDQIPDHFSKRKPA